MASPDIDKVLRELDAWCRRERGGRLTWKRLAEVAGFSRQTLSSHEEIAERYGQAKIANGPSKRAKPSAKGVDQRVIDLQRRVEQLKNTINQYDERWARYARNAAILGIDLERLDQALDPPARSGTRSMQRPGRRNGNQRPFRSNP